jgi:hypothetical protein
VHEDRPYGHGVFERMPLRNEKNRVRRMLLLSGLAIALAGAGVGRVLGDDSNNTVIARTEDYISSLNRLLALYKDSAVSAAHVFKQRSELYRSGLISRQDFEACRRALEESRSRIEDVRSRITASQTLIAEARLAEELSKEHAQDQSLKETVVFHTGSASFKLSDVSLVEHFYSKHFGIPLPISALGQTELHSRMGFDHRESVDVAVQPDSPEGLALMEFLRTSGISFIAFRSALPGSSTGAHIHIGHPSARIAVAGIPGSHSTGKPGS